MREWIQAFAYGFAAAAMTWVILMGILHGSEIVDRVVSLIVYLMDQ